MEPPSERKPLLLVVLFRELCQSRLVRVDALSTSIKTPSGDIIDRAVSIFQGVERRVISLIVVVNLRRCERAVTNFRLTDLLFTQQGDAF